MNMRPPVQGLGLGRDRVVPWPGPGHSLLPAAAGSGAHGARQGQRGLPAVVAPWVLSRPLWGMPMFMAELPHPHPHAEALCLLKALTACEDGWRWAFQELVKLCEISGASSKLTRVLRRDRGRDMR